MLHFPLDESSISGDAEPPSAPPPLRRAAPAAAPPPRGRAAAPVGAVVTAPGPGSVVVPPGARRTDRNFFGISPIERNLFVQGSESPTEHYGGMSPIEQHYGGMSPVEHYVQGLNESLEHYVQGLNESPTEEDNFGISPLALPLDAETARLEERTARFADHAVDHPQGAFSRSNSIGPSPTSMTKEGTMVPTLAPTPSANLVSVNA